VTEEAPLSGRNVPESEGTPDASEEWVEGQPPSDADYGGDPERDPASTP
jgi:hypothetical protein